eukprot:2612876-Rhodomonas_salina.1
MGRILGAAAETHVVPLAPLANVGRHGRDGAVRRDAVVLLHRAQTRRHRKRTRGSVWWDRAFRLQGRPVKVTGAEGREESQDGRRRRRRTSTGRCR